MKVTVQLKGVDTVLRNLNREIEKAGGASMKGLIRASILIRRDMDHTTPLIPVDTGKLRSSWFIDTFYASKFRPVLEMGFSAFYAWYVHELFGAHFKRPGAGWKFFESALFRNTRLIVRTIQEEVSWH